MIDVEFAVVKLTEPHTVWVDGQQATSDPLITMLWEARYPNLGKTMGGAGSGMPFDTHAVDLYEHIDGTVRSWLAHFREHSTGDLLTLTRRLCEVIQAEDAGGRLEDRDRMYGMFQQFVQLIEDKFDPPAEKELVGDCPECEKSHVEDDNGDQKRAVRIIVKPGRALVAECHACGKLWAGQESLTSLAETLGADIDWVALRDLVNTPKENADTER